MWSCQTGPIVFQSIGNNIRNLIKNIFLLFSYLAIFLDFKGNKFKVAINIFQ